MLLLLLGCSQSTVYEETFAATGNWRVGDDVVAEGEVKDGVYQLYVEDDVGIYWTTAGEIFANGLYSVETRQVNGPVDAAYGMLFRVDDSSNNFYKFAITPDGFARVDVCYNSCGQEDPIISDWWFETDTIIQGLGETNRLSVEANYNNLIFFVNGTEIGRVTNKAFSGGDIGMFVETLGIGDVRVEFDNFRVEPLK